MASKGTQEVATVRDNYGDEIDFAAEGANVRIVFGDSDGHVLVMLLDAERRDQFIKAYADAERQAEAYAEVPGGC